MNKYILIFPLVAAFASSAVYAVTSPYPAIRYISIVLCCVSAGFTVYILLRGNKNA